MRGGRKMNNKKGLSRSDHCRSSPCRRWPAHFPKRGDVGTIRHMYRIWHGVFFTLGLSGLVYLLRVPPGERRKTEENKKIEVNDERNVRIREKTGSMVAKVMTYVLCIFLLVLTLMGADKGIVLMAAGLWPPNWYWRPPSPVIILKGCENA